MLDSSQFETPKDLYPFEHRFVELKGGSRIHYLDEGKGATLLLLHGNPTWSFLYRKIVAGMRGTFRCVALDYPGFGMSRPPSRYGFTPAEHSGVVEAFVDQMGLTDLTLMVQDWGGPIGLGFAGRRPELVRRLIIGNTWAWPTESSLQGSAFSWVMGGPIGRLVSRSFNGVVRLFLAQGVVNKLEPEVREMYMAPFRDPASRRPVTIFPWLITRSNEYLKTVERGLARLSDRPVLILWGAKDFAFKEKDRLHFEQIFPRYRTVVLENAGHFIQEDAPQEICSAIGTWSE